MASSDRVDVEHRRWSLAPLAALAFVLVLAACSSDDPGAVGDDSTAQRAMALAEDNVVGNSAGGGDEVHPTVAQGSDLMYGLQLMQPTSPDLRVLDVRPVHTGNVRVHAENIVGTDRQAGAASRYGWHPLETDLWAPEEVQPFEPFVVPSDGDDAGWGSSCSSG